MVTASEIRARVEAADRARIEARATAAERVLTAVQQRDEIAAKLSSADAAIGAAIAEASSVMTLDELADFMGRPLRELKAITLRTGGSRRRRPAKKNHAGNSKPAAPTPKAPTEPAA